MQLNTTSRLLFIILLLVLGTFACTPPGETQLPEGTSTSSPKTEPDPEDEPLPAEDSSADLEQGYPMAVPTQPSSRPGYPVPEETVVSPPSEYVPSTPEPIQPSPGKGTVTGVLVRQLRGMDPQPVINIRLFLAKILYDENNQIALASLDENAAPLSLTNAGGQFTFLHVEPGDYALIIRTPIQAILAHDVVSDLDVTVKIGSDQVAELGEVHVDIQY